MGSINWKRIKVLLLISTIPLFILVVIFLREERLFNRLIKFQSNEQIKVNVKDYGAYGNGIQDDTAAIQSAIDDVAKKGGGQVFIPAGVYSLHPIFLKTNVHLIGENRASVILKLSDQAEDGYTRVINLENIKNVVIQNITCDGNFQNHQNGTEHMHCIFVWDSEKVIINNNRLVNAVGDGISISGSTAASDDITISNNMLENNHRSNIVLEQVNHLKIFNNISTSTIGRPVLHFEPWEEMSFYDAKIWNNTLISNIEEGNCILLEGGKQEGNFFHNIDFYENHVSCPSGEFLVMETKDANIHHNKLNVSSIFVWIKNEDLTLKNNQITSKKGIVIEGTWGMISKRTVIAKNTITTLENGIDVIAGAQDTTITKNKFKGSGGTAVSLFASETDITNTNITENTFQNFEYGIVDDSNADSSKRIDGLVVRRNKFTNVTP